ncbi:MAG: DUF4159 domain-containing protein [Candidatus Solibacter usitatus]|nr:DUF4159 domain-containing protein [Candidatus Solibacter usitatus]
MRGTSVCTAAVLLATVLFAQRGFRRGFGEEDNPAPLPADATEKTEYVFARLRYPSFRGSYYRRGSWATDYPKADRQFLQGVRRLTRTHARSAEQVVDVDSDEIYRYPWVYAVEVGHWELSQTQGAHLREYLDRGGFLMVDDFHGADEWEIFEESFRRIFPDRPIVELENSDSVFHVLYELDERFQVPGVHTIWSGRTHEKGGVDPRWRGVYDQKGRLVVAICHNMDLGDAWEWADEPRYPERYASLAYRIGVNYIIYSMTH